MSSIYYLNHTPSQSAQSQHPHTSYVCTDLVFCSCAGIFGWKQYLFATCILIHRRNEGGGAARFAATAVAVARLKITTIASRAEAEEEARAKKNQFFS